MTDRNSLERIYAPFTVRNLSIEKLNQINLNNMYAVRSSFIFTHSPYSHKLDIINYSTNTHSFHNLLTHFNDNRKRHTSRHDD